MRGRLFDLRALLAAVFLGLVLALTLGAAAYAATPQDIYNDYAADGDLDGTYTDEELNAVLSDPLLAQYADPNTLDKLKKLIRGGSTTRETFPFTGAQMALILGGGVVLVAVGVLLRRGRRHNEGV